MPFSRFILPAAASILASSSISAAAAASAPDCAAMAKLLRDARTDFPSLRRIKMTPGKCSYRDTEYKCEWAFPGDAFAVSDEQSARLVQCVSANPAAQPAKSKRGQTAFAVDPDLTLLIGAPEVHTDGWKVTLKIQSSWKPR
jgi:hypothetical protein